MGRGKSRTKIRLKTHIIALRIDLGTKQDLDKFADSLGVTVSGLLLANVRHMLRERKVGFPLPGEAIPISAIELEARRRRAIDSSELIDWSKFDVYDG
jgi:hypothetical protein